MVPGTQRERDAALIRAVRGTSLQALAEALELGANINARGGPESLSVLEWAVLSRRPELVEIVLAAGARVNNSYWGRTALDLAQTDSTSAIRDLLVSVGAVGGERT